MLRQERRKSEFERIASSLFVDYAAGSFPLLRQRFGHIQALEHGSPNKLIALDAIDGMITWKAGQTKEAAELWRKVILSSKASNADKMLAHAGMAMFYIKEGNSFAYRAALKELDELSCGYRANLWLVEALKNLLETLINNEIIECKCKIFGIAIEICKTLETDSDEKIIKEIYRLRADIGFTYAVHVLIGSYEYNQAKYELQHNVMPLYEILGEEMKVVDCLSQLALICRQQGRSDEAAVVEEKGEEMRLRSRYS